LNKGYQIFVISILILLGRVDLAAAHSKKLLYSFIHLHFTNKQINIFLAVATN